MFIAENGGQKWNMKGMDRGCWELLGKVKDQPGGWVGWHKRKE
jgi:hypothetical protein